MTTVQLPIPNKEIAVFCQRWKVTEFALFGSILRDDFRSDSDVDVLVTFSEGAQIIGLRNVLAHEYGEVKVDRIYLAATISIPVLLEALEPLSKK